MIVAGPEGFRKNQYRKFNIKSENLTPGDDFGMMREVLTRRFKRLMAKRRVSSARGCTLPLERGGRRSAVPGEAGRVARAAPQRPRLRTSQRARLRFRRRAVTERGELALASPRRRETKSPPTRPGPIWS